MSAQGAAGRESPSPPGRTSGRWPALAVAGAAAALFAGSFAARVLSERGRESAPSPEGGAPRRIVSLAPSITEILFALGLGERVVGVTRYCDYPPEAATRPKVGGYYDPNYEAIVRLRPDLVVLLPEHETPRRYLSGLGIETLAVGNHGTGEVLDAVRAVGVRCGAAERAGKIVSDVEARLGRIVKRTRDLPRPRVLVSVGRAMGSGSLEDVYVAGEGTFFDEVISLAGGVNAYSGGMVKYAALSAEGIIRLDPEVIIDLVADIEESGLDEKAVLEDWEGVSGVAAARTGRVHVLGQDYVVVPGPRFILLVEDVARLVHPEIDWPEIDRPEIDRPGIDWKEK